MSTPAMGTNNLEAFWMPFTANRQFKQNPRLLVGAKDMTVLMAGAAALSACSSQAPAPTQPAQSAQQPATGASSPATQAPAKQQMKAIKFTLPWIPTGEVAFYYAAKQLGYYQQRGLDVDIQRGFGSGTAAKQTGLGQFDFAQADMGAVLSSIVDGLDLVSIGVTSPSPVTTTRRFIINGE